MRGSVARELRKACKFVPKEKRTYQDIEFTVRRQIYQFGLGGVVDLVWRDVPAYLIECTSGSRKVYKYFKRKWNNPDFVAEFSTLPSAEDLDELAKTVMDDEELTDAMIASKKKNTGRVDK